MERKEIRDTASHSNTGYLYSISSLPRCILEHELFIENRGEKMNGRATSSPIRKKWPAP